MCIFLVLWSWEHQFAAGIACLQITQFLSLRRYSHGGEAVVSEVTKNKNKNKFLSSPDSYEAAIIEVKGGFIGLVSHAPCEMSVQSSLLKVTMKKKRG